MLHPTTRSEAVPDWVRKRDANPHGTLKMGLLSKMHPLWPYTPLRPYPGCREPCFKITPDPCRTLLHEKKLHLLDLGTISCTVVAEGGAKLPVIKKQSKSICFSLHQAGFNPKYFNLPLGFLGRGVRQRGSGSTGWEGRIGAGLQPPPANIVQGNHSFLGLFDGQEEQRRLSLQAHGWAGVAGLQAGIHRWKGSRCAASPQV